LLTKTQVLRTIPRGGAKTHGLKHEQTLNDACKTGLPYCTFSGIFSKRAADKLIERSEYFCLDLDHVGPNGQIKEKGRLIYSLHKPALMFTSPNADGLKVVFQIDPSAGTHLEFFTAFKHFFATKIGFPIDESCSDISRACFLCHDPEVVFEENPDIIGAEFLIKPEILPVSEGLTYEGAKKWTLEKEEFINSNRNHFIVTLADCCNRYQIDKQEALTKIITDFAIGDFTAEEITTTVENRYNHQEWHGIALTPDSKCLYIRVAIYYHKTIDVPDRYGTMHRELISWNKDTLMTDHGRKYLRNIPKYDAFIMRPDNLNYKQVIGNCYNLYNPFNHIAAEGDWTWTKRLLEHVFGDQYEQGLRYMQILYLYPEKQTVILTLVSIERGTGKSTFVNWLNMIFGDNMVLLSGSDFVRDFNFYAKKNIIAVEETLFERKLIVERLKALTTQESIAVNEKYIKEYMIPFHGKIILTSNYEDKFALVDKEEIRFFVRKLGTPIHTNRSILNDLLKEIPAFLYYLQSLSPLDWKNPPGRSGFSNEELKNEFLDAVVKGSRHEITKEIMLFVEDYFNTHENINQFYAAPIDIKKKFFPYDSRKGVSWIKDALKDDLDMLPEKFQRYYPFEEETEISKPGTPYLFKRTI
jgi:hypothetical protein